MAEYSKMAHGTFVSTGSSQAIPLPYDPDYVQVWNLTLATSPSGATPINIFWNAFMAQNDGVGMQLTGADPETLGTYDAYPNGITTYSAALALQYQAAISIEAVSTASPAVVTTRSNHGYNTGDVVTLSDLYASPSTGMQQIAGIPFQITVTGDATFTIPWSTNKSNYTAVSNSGFVRKLSFPFLYLPGVCFISSIVNGSTTTVTTTVENNYVLGQQVGFRIPPAWRESQLNYNNNIPGSPLYGYVSEIISPTEFVCTIDSSSFSQFNTNVPFGVYSGLSFPQVVAVGDINTGGLQYNGSQLYPSSTVNGPAISGAFLNNTQNGFIIGSSLLTGSTGNYIYWQAYYHDYSNGVSVPALS